jgi:hypothetical protein
VASKTYSSPFMLSGWGAISITSKFPGQDTGVIKLDAVTEINSVLCYS